jgi:hypothetical protein|tara:strand:+ start:2491 stop:2934 length:444 start_codon:yes stop_codon:yes gene_type:complete
MANVISNVFKDQLLKGNHDFQSGGDTYKIALYTSSKTATASDPTVYNTTNESSGTGYTAAGNTLTNNGVTGGSSATTAYVDFTDTSWTTVTVTARYAQIYQSSGAAASASASSVCVLDFGGNFTTTAGTFTIQFPAAGTSTAILRLA